MIASTDAAQPNIENIIPILMVQNLSNSIEYYQQMLGFSKDWSDDDFAGLSRDGWGLYLCEGDQGQPGTWLWIGVEDVDRMYQECQSKGAIIKKEMTRHPWAREFHVVDPGGHVLRIGGMPKTHEH